MYTASHVMMVRPVQSGLNKKLANDTSNSFPIFASSLFKEALKEFDSLVALLKDSGIQISLHEEPIESLTPQTIFSTNWISFHHPGHIIQYPLYSKPLVRSFRQEIIQQLLAHNSGWQHTNLSDYEQVGVFLEGMGSFVLDREAGIAYACESTHTHLGFFERFCQFFQWEPIMFKRNENLTLDVPYTSMLLSVGEEFAILCEEAIAEEDQEGLRDQLIAGGRELILCDLEQVHQFACSLVPIKNGQGDPLIILSQRALKSLKTPQIAQLEKYGTLLPVFLNAIENLGVGGLRCILTEVFEPKP